MKPVRQPLDFSLTEPPAVLAAVQGAATPIAPQPLPAVRDEALKQLNTRIPVATHQAFKIAAIQEGVSVQELLARLIDSYLAGKD